jgi:hypothetical protein
VISCGPDEDGRRPGVEIPKAGPVVLARHRVPSHLLKRECFFWFQAIRSTPTRQLVKVADAHSLRAVTTYTKERSHSLHDTSGERSCNPRLADYVRRWSRNQRLNGLLKSQRNPLT